MSPALRPGRAARAALLAIAALGLACSTLWEKTAVQGADSTLELLGISNPEVLSTALHGPYRSAVLRGRSSTLGFLFPASTACEHVLQPEAVLGYSKRGLFGRYERDGESCDAVGTLSVGQWRARRARPTTKSPSPSGTARYAILYRDEELILLRGRFPLLNLMGVSSGDLVVAVPSTDPACVQAAEAGTTTIVYASAGPRPYRLMAGSALCDVSGFALPPEAIPGG